MSTSPIPSVIGTIHGDARSHAYHAGACAIQSDTSWQGMSRGSPPTALDLEVAMMSERTGENPILCHAKIQGSRASKTSAPTSHVRGAGESYSSVLARFMATGMSYGDAARETNALCGPGALLRDANGRGAIVRR